MKSYIGTVHYRIDGVENTIQVNVRAESQMDALVQTVSWAERRGVFGVIGADIARV